MTTCASKALDSLSELDQRVLRLLLVAVDFIIIFGIGAREGIIEVQVVVVRRASSWGIWISGCITIIGQSVKLSFNGVVTAFRLVLIIIRVSWGLGGCMMSGEAEELVDDLSSLSIASKNAEGIISG